MIKEVVSKVRSNGNNLRSREQLVDAETVELETGIKASYQEKARRLQALPHYKIGARVYYKMSEVWQWIDQRKVVK